MSFSGIWRHLSGEGNWCLLDPLNVELRRYIIQYGQMAGVSGDLAKEICGTMVMPFDKENYFSLACLEKGNNFKYKVTSIIFTTVAAMLQMSGYVAVSDGNDAMERVDVLISWRGIPTDSEWDNCLLSELMSNPQLFGREEAKVHKGFVSVYLENDSRGELGSPRDRVREEVSKLVEEHKDKDISITVTGFSLGGALATINALDLVVNGYNKPRGNPNKSCMVTAFIFGSPPVGNDGFKKAIDDHHSELHILRIENLEDPVLRYLSKKLGEEGYLHVGELLKVDSSKSHYLKQRALGVSHDSSYPFDIFIKSIIEGRRVSDEWLSPHNLDVYLHAVAGVKKGGFHLAVDHDIALVNKHLNHLKDEYGIPDNWWRDPNREKMYQLENGHWKVKVSEPNLSLHWRVLSGLSKWCLLDPLDLDLRRYIIHYGQMVGACGDLFDAKTRTCQSNQGGFFYMACLDKGNNFKYKVTNYIVASSATVEPTWYGYVAVSDGEKDMGRMDILIAWRGCTTYSEWTDNLNIDQQSYPNIFGGEDVMMHSGFLSLYTGVRRQHPYDYSLSARDQVVEAISKLLEEHKDKDISITVTGFGLGAALATMNALDIVVNGHNKPKGNPKMSTVTAFVFGSPPVGNKGFKKAVDDRHSELHILRITNLKDLIPKLIPSGGNNSYMHVGKELIVDCSKSTYLKQHAWEESVDQLLDSDESTQGEGTSKGSIPNDINNLFRFHNMDLYLHAVAGVQKDGFSLAVDHDIALVNKHSDLLKDEYGIPGNWWDGPDRKKMTQQENGQWDCETRVKIKQDPSSNK